MNHKSIGLGLTLILLGCFWLLKNLGFFTWSMWDALFELWPLVFVVIGINIIFREKHYVRIVTWLLFFIAIVSFGFFQEQNYESGYTVTEPNVEMETKPGVIQGVLELDLGGGNVNIQGNTEKLVDAHIPNPYVENKIEFIDGGKTAKVAFKETSHKKLPERKELDYRFHLDENLVWDIDIDMGAMNGNFDFSQLKVSRLDMDLGAVNSRLVFGEITQDVKVDIDAGVSNVEIVLPKGVPARIRAEGLIKKVNFEGESWTLENGYYTSPSYFNADNVMNISVDSGGGKLDVIVK